MASNSSGISVNLSELQAGMVLPADVFDARNASVLLLRRGTPITAAFLDLLRARGVQRVMVDEASAAIIRGEAPPARKPPPRRPAAKSNEPKPVVRPIERLQRPDSPLPSPEANQRAAEAKLERSRQLQEVFSAAAKNSNPSGHLAKQIVGESVSDMMADLDVFLKVSLETSESSETYEHCLATAQLAMSVGVVDGLDEQAIQDLGAGCLLSRIGQSEAANRSAEQMRALNNIEMMDLKRTPSRTFDCMQNMRDISVGARNVAYQIFERFNGTGYPRARAGSQISPLARIAAVCDVYVALTSPRPYRMAYEPYQAVEMLLRETREGKFDPAAVRSLLRTIGLFPLGSFVRLSDGTLGQVVRNHNDAYDRPVVQYFFDNEGNSLEGDARTVDLSTCADLKIDSAVSAEVVRDMKFQSIPGLDGFDADEEVNAGDSQLCLAFEEQR